MNSEEQAIEELLQSKGLTAPRVAPQDVDDNIMRAEFHRLDGTNITVCVMTLRNGFTVTGVNHGSVDPANYDAQVGQDLAYTDARNKLWSLMGYALKEKQFRERGLPLCLAKMTHAVNRAYCKALGDDSQLAWDDAPDWQKDSAIAGVQFRLENDSATPEEMHANWMAQKAAEGWVYGEVKDEVAGTHPCMKPYDELPVEQRAKDYIFSAVIDAAKGVI